MRIDLIDLLGRKKIAHSSRFHRLESKFDASLTIEVGGVPWWSNAANPGIEGNAIFCFEGISDGIFDARFFVSDVISEDLEFFDVRPLAEVDWARDPHCNVFCSSPISDPIGLFAALHDFLNRQECPFPPMRYLNPQNGTLREFSEIALSRSFLVCSAPEGIADFVCSVLRKQVVPFTILRGQDVSAGLFWVRIGASQFACTKAYAIIDN